MSYTYTDKIKFAYTPNFDAFSRLRVSEPVTLFDSSNRYSDNEKWATSTSGTGSATFNANEGLVDLTIGGASGDSVLRETYRTFAYQPGKSLLVLNTFVLAAPQAGLRQRVGYFGSSNGIFLETNGTTTYLVERTSTSGSPVDTPVAQASWNVDPMDGSGPSGVTLDLTKAQIFWSDFEWLGVGSVRTGFVIDGEFITCHVFHHANIITSTYMTTACLPCRYEITNTAATSATNTLKQICTSVLSEGGYELRGESRAISTTLTSAYNLAISGTYYPIVSIRLKSSRLDGIVVPNGVSLLPLSSGNYGYRIVIGGTTTGGAWTSVAADSQVEYNTTGTSFSGGKTAIQGFFSQTNQASSSINLADSNPFTYQLRRNSFTSTPIEFTLCSAVRTAGGGGNNMLGAIDWEEITK